MDHFAGLDVSVKETSICIVDDAGKIVREVKVASEPEALLAVLKNPAYHFKRIGLEAGPLSQWLFSALAEAGLPVICVETRDMQAVLKAQINKTDRNDARGIAQMMRAGLYRPVHVKRIRSQKRARVRAIKPLEPRGSAGAGANSMYGRSPVCKSFFADLGVVGPLVQPKDDRWPCCRQDDRSAKASERHAGWPAIACGQKKRAAHAAFRRIRRQRPLSVRRPMGHQHRFHALRTTIWRLPLGS